MAANLAHRKAVLREHHASKRLEKLASYSSCNSCSCAGWKNPTASTPPNAAFNGQQSATAVAAAAAAAATDPAAASHTTASHGDMVSAACASCRHSLAAHVVMQPCFSESLLERKRKELGVASQGSATPAVTIEQSDVQRVQLCDANEDLMDEQVLRVVDMERIYLLVQQTGGTLPAGGQAGGATTSTTGVAAGSGGGSGVRPATDLLSAEAGGQEVDVMVHQALVIMFRVLRRSVLKSEAPTFEDSPLATLPFSKPTLSQAMYNFLMSRFGHLGPGNFSTMHDLTRLFLHCLMHLNMDTPSRHESLNSPKGSPGDGSSAAGGDKGAAGGKKDSAQDIARNAYRREFLGWMCCCCIPQHFTTLTSHNVLEAFSKPFLRSVFESVKKHIYARARSDKEKMSAKNQALVLTHLPKFFLILEKEVMSDGGPMWDVNYRPNAASAGSALAKQVIEAGMVQSTFPSEGLGGLTSLQWSGQILVPTPATGLLQSPYSATTAIPNAANTRSETQCCTATF
ncbi:histone acetyltransferase KAT2B-like isoform X2 [Sycon ciliatum]|uniref:histone acetyltransferase KAT2B-like isoform X2 n=1 Tax=Sycon ciliatum TaxID=27933 RepID=UPI0031F63F05